MQRFGAQSLSHSLKQSAAAQASFPYGASDAVRQLEGVKKKDVLNPESPHAARLADSGGFAEELGQGFAKIHLVWKSSHANIWCGILCGLPQCVQACRLYEGDCSRFTALVMWSWKTTGDRGFSCVWNKV